jgi:ribosomal protein S27E
MPIRENRWMVDAVRCMDCDREFIPARVDRDAHRQAGIGSRFLLVVMPETCPNCHNLKAVPQEPPP